MLSRYLSMVPIQTKSYDSVRQSSNWNWVWSALLHVGRLDLATKSIANYCFSCVYLANRHYTNFFYFVHSWNSARRTSSDDWFYVVSKSLKWFCYRLITYRILYWIVTFKSWLSIVHFVGMLHKKCVASVSLMLFFLFCSWNLAMYFENLQDSPLN